MLKQLLMAFTLLSATTAVFGTALSIPSEPPVPALPKPTVIAPTQTQQLDSSISPQAWVLHLNNIVDKQQASKLIQQLQSDGYPAYEVLKQDGQVRIWVGPSISKKLMIDRQQQLEKQYKLSSRLEAFEPTFPKESAQ